MGIKKWSEKKTSKSGKKYIVNKAKGGSIKDMLKLYREGKEIEKEQAKKK